MSAEVAIGAPTRPAADQAAAPWRKLPLTAIGGTAVAGIVLPLLLSRISIGDYIITLLILFFMQAVVDNVLVSLDRDLMVKVFGWDPEVQGY